MVGDIVAFIALILSIISLYWQWKDKTPHLVVVLSLDRASVWTAHDDTTGRDVYKTRLFLHIRLENHGNESIHVETLYLQPRKSLNVMLYEYNSIYQKQSPRCTVESRQNHKILVATSELVKSLEQNGLDSPIEATVIVCDEIGRSFRSKRKIRFTVKQLLEDLPEQE